MTIPFHPFSGIVNNGKKVWYLLPGYTMLVSLYFLLSNPFSGAHSQLPTIS